MKFDSWKPAWFALLETVLEIAYVCLVVTFMNYNGSLEHNTPEILIGGIMIFLFSFSAAVMGVLVFGYPLYLFVKQEFGRAMRILMYNLLFSFAAIVIAAGAVILFA